MANLGHEIALSEIRQSARSFAIRTMWSLGNALFVSILSMAMLGPNGFILNSFRYLYFLINFQIRKLPILGVREIDIHHVALYYSKVMTSLWFWNVVFGLALFTFLASFTYFTFHFLKKGKREQLERIMRGNKLVTVKEHNKVMVSEYKKHPPYEMGNRLVLGKEQVIIPESIQYLHFGFFGASGCGKSVAMEEIVEQVIERAISKKQKGFVIDLNGAYFSKFGRPQDHVLSLRDPRTRAWDFWCEKGVEAENLAAAMIEADASSNNQFFWKGARAVLSSLLKHTNSCSELWEDFRKSTSDIRKKLENSNELSQRIIGQGDGDQADGILGTTVLDFAFLKELNQWTDEKNSKLSITEWFGNNQDTSWIYVIVSDKDLEITKPLLRVWFDIACHAALNRDPDNPENVHTFLFNDEAKSPGQLPSLPGLLDKGRKYKTSVVLSFQAISQIQKIYGDTETKSILQGIQNQFYFKASDNTSAQYASDALGEQELEQVNVGVSFGQKKDSDRGSLNTATTRKKVVLPDEIKSLKSLHCYAKLCHHQPFKLNFEVKNRPRIQAPAKSQINYGYVIGAEKKTPSIPTKQEANDASVWTPGTPLEEVKS